MWMTPDPLGYTDSSTLYAFGAGDPVNHDDARGTSLIDNYYEPIGWDEYKTELSNAWNSPALQGTLQIVGGCGEALLGSYAIAQTAGLATLPGYVALVHGSDVCAAGIMTLATGEIQDSMTKRGARAALTAVGVSPGTAEIASTYVDIAVGAYGSVGSARSLLGLGRAPLTIPPGAFEEEPSAYGTPYKQLGKQKYKQLQAKVAARTITREEWKRLQWFERLSERRERGVDLFWAAERQRLAEGLPGTRAWSPSQEATILNGRTPRGIAGHHRYSVSSYPQIANDPANIYPVTFNEHLNRWHNGAWANQTHGIPLNPSVPEDF